MNQLGLLILLMELQISFTGILLYSHLNDFVFSFWTFSLRTKRNSFFMQVPFCVCFHWPYYWESPCGWRRFQSYHGWGIRLWVETLILMVTLYQSLLQASLFGTIINSLTHQLFTGVQGKGAFLNGKPIKGWNFNILLSHLTV